MPTMLPGRLSELQVAGLARLKSTFEGGERVLCSLDLGISRSFSL